MIQVRGVVVSCWDGWIVFGMEVQLGYTCTGFERVGVLEF